MIILFLPRDYLSLSMTSMKLLNNQQCKQNLFADTLVVAMVIWEIDTIGKRHEMTIRVHNLNLKENLEVLFNHPTTYTLINYWHEVSNQCQVNVLMVMLGTLAQIAIQPVCKHMSMDYCCNGCIWSIVLQGVIGIA